MSGLRIAVAARSLSGIDELPARLAGAADVVVGDVATPEQVAALTAGADGLVVSLQRLTADHIGAMADSVRVIGRAGVGLDTIDLDAAAARRVAVVYQPDYATNEVADQAMALLLATHRRVVQADRAIRAHGWPGGTELGPIPALQQTVAGVVGTGRIGRAMIARLSPFVREVLAHDPFDTSTADGFTRVDALADIFERAQVISLHVPLSPATRHFIGAAELARARPDAVLVNVSRGGLIDEDALATALREGRLGGAGLDVFEDEPLPADSPLRTAPNLVLSPHMAWYSSESSPRLADWTVTDVVAVAGGEQPRHGRFAVRPGGDPAV
jgi:D-3-phosphoglycerate dehydrogenase / 2-oxoglutarate reductase